MDKNLTCHEWCVWHKSSCGVGDSRLDGKCVWQELSLLAFLRIDVNESIVLLLTFLAFAEAGTMFGQFIQRSLSLITVIIPSWDMALKRVHAYNGCFSDLHRTQLSSWGLFPSELLQALHWRMERCGSSNLLLISPSRYLHNRITFLKKRERSLFQYNSPVTCHFLWSLLKL